MEKQCTAHHEDTGKCPNPIEPEFVTLTNGQNAVIGENADSGKLPYRTISPDEANMFFGKQKA